jgi:hypothetical protein
MDENAALGGAGIGVDGIEWLEAQDLAGINGIGIAHPRLDLRHRQPARPRCHRRAGFGRQCR